MNASQNSIQVRVWPEDDILNFDIVRTHLLTLLLFGNKDPSIFKSVHPDMPDLQLPLQVLTRIYVRLYMLI